MTDFQSKLCACILGGAIGDSLGFLNENKHHRQILSLNTIQHPQITDDTQMTLFTMDALRHTVSINVLKRYYFSWLDTQKQFIPFTYVHPKVTWLTNNKIMWKTMLPGNTVMSALESDIPNQNSIGNGAMMRIAPYIFLSVLKSEKIKLTIQNTKLTHNNQTACQYSRYYIELLLSLFNNPENKITQLPIYLHFSILKLSNLNLKYFCKKN